MTELPAWCWFQNKIVPIDGRFHFARSMASFAGPSVEMRIVTERAGVPLKAKTISLMNVGPEFLLLGVGASVLMPSVLLFTPLAC